MFCSVSDRVSCVCFHPSQGAYVGQHYPEGHKALDLYAVCSGMFGAPESMFSVSDVYCDCFPRPQRKLTRLLLESFMLKMQKSCRTVTAITIQSIEIPAIKREACRAGELRRRGV